MTRQTIILIHGFRGTHHGLSLIGEHLNDVNVIIPDLPGFGEGHHLETYDLDGYVEWLWRFIKAQKLKKIPMLLGHSFGSIVCAAYAKKYPHTIAKLILVNPIGAPALQGPKAVMSQLAVFYYWVGTKLPARLAQPWLASKLIVMLMSVTLAKTKDKKLRAYIHDQHLQYFSRFHSPESVAGGFKTSVTHNVREFASAITTPTLLIAGDEDDITPIEKQKELVKLFPQAQLKTIKDVGHLTHYETPDQVAAFVQAFIKLV